jgi:transcriptional regulator with XRE-family HTH domain
MKASKVDVILERAVKRHGAAAVGRRLGVSARTVQGWASGDRAPSGAARALLLSAYGSSTTKSPATATKKPAAPSPPASSSESSTPIEDTTSKSRLLALLDILRDRMVKADADESTNREIAALANAYTAAERQYARVAGEFQLTESMIVRSAPFARAMAIVRTVLEKYPGAAKELDDKLEQLGGGT